MPSPTAKELLTSIAANVRRLRGQRGLTQAELAERAALDLRQLQRIERGEINFGVVSVLRLADALRVRPGALLGRARLAPPRRGRPPRA
jgi:transcriptional regulator with XRE-family HTH domain